MTGYLPFQPEDYPLLDGYETINLDNPKHEATVTDDSGKEITIDVFKGSTFPIKDDPVTIGKLKTVAGIEETDTSEYLVMPIVYKKQKFNLTFNSNATNIAPATIRDIPYNCTIVNPENPVEGDPNIPGKETEVKTYLAKFTKAEINPDTKEVTNIDVVTKNQKGHLFMGWYLDPGYTIPFDEHMPMPAQNLQVFAKWEPLYHYIIVHHVPAGINGVNAPKNITELKIPHDELINTQEEILKNPPILSGRARSDFQGWETYGDVKNEIPSPDGTTGGPFLYKFDNPVTTAFHLYPRWYVNKVGVVYAYNYNESDRPLEEGEEIDDIMKNLDNSDKDPLTKENRYYMSEYKYPLGAKVRLRAPFGWDTQGKIKEPEAPERTKAHGKVFLGWKVMYRDKLYPFAWHTVDGLVYYNSEIEFTENNVSHKSDAKRGDAVGVIVLVAQWGEKKINTNLTLHRNNDATDLVKKEYNIEDINQDWPLPNLENTNDLADKGLTDFQRDKYQFLGWNTKADGSGKMYKPGENIYIDEQYAPHINHLYAQWEKYYTLEAEKEWKPNKSDYDFKLGLLRWTAPSTTKNPDFTTQSGFVPVKASLKSYKTDLEADGKMKWEVPGLDEDGNRYSYVIVEVKPGMENAFKKFTSWDQLNIEIDKTLKSKTQTIALTDANNEVDTFTSATLRSSKRNPAGKIIGYNFTVTNEKIVVPMPVITLPYADQNVIVITPGKESDKKVEKVKKIVVTLPDVTILELTKDTNTGHFTTSNNTDYIVTADLTGKLTITLPAGKKLGKGQVITAIAKNAGDVPSEIDSKTVLDAQDSFKIGKPVQEKRDSDYNVVIKADIPNGTTVVDGTTFTLTDENGNIIKNGQTPITGTLDKDGHVVFKVPDGILKDGQQVQIQTQEPNKNATLSKPSEQLDLTGPEITANNITGKVGNPIAEATISTDEAANINITPNLPNSLVLGEPNTAKTEWKITGKGEYVTTTTHTVVAVDKFGNKTEATFTVTITNKDVIDTPVIDDIAKGDTSVKITPPTKGDTLVVTFPNGKEVTLTKDNAGNWKDKNNKDYPVTDGKLDVPVPDNGTLNVSDIVTAQGKDSTGKLADSPKVVKSVGQSTKKTPTPQFAKITVGDENFKIKPVDQEADKIITDKLVITIRNEKGKEEKQIILTKTNNKWSDGQKEYTPDQEGYITIALKGVTLTPKHSFGATGEDTFHGHAISIPTSINVNAEQSKKPTASQGESKENGNPTITGKGEPGADINVYDPNGNLIAGPVKVDKEGNYEIEVPKNSIPANGVVDVKQKEDGKPESEATEVTIDKEAPDAPVIEQPNVGDEVVKITPPADASKITVTMPDGSKVELSKNPNGTTWTDGDGVEHQVVDGKINLPTKPLKNNDVIKATAADKFGNTSGEATKKVGNTESFATEKPEQKPKNANGDVVIESKIPEGSNPLPGTTYTLVNEAGDPIAGKDGQAITATPDQDGKLTFNVPDGILQDKQKVNVKTQEPGKQAKTTELSEALDLVGPVITANDITGKVGVAIEEATISTTEAADITLTPNLPNNLVLGDANQTKTEWKITGKGEYVTTTTTHKVVAVDKFGNKTEKTFTVTITNKDVIDTPVIDDIAKGDTSVKITPPTKGDTLVVTFPGNKTVTLTKDNAGNWKDKNNKDYPVTDGKLEVPVPDNGTLNVGDIVIAQGKDSTGTLANSTEAKKSVGQSTKKTPAPQFKQIMEKDTSFMIKPVDQEDAGIITDKLVITISENNKEVKKITLTKTNGKWSDGTKEYTPDPEGYLTVSLEGITLTPKHSFGATGEDTKHGHIISDPTSINVNEKPCDKPKTAKQGETKLNGKFTITGMGIPEAEIKVYNPTTGDLIAGPVKVGTDGTYEIELPKDSIPANGKVVVKQKCNCKPESEESIEVTIDKTKKPPVTPELPGKPETPDNSGNSGNSGNSEAPGTPDNSGNSEAPGTPDNSGIPETPGTPGNSETPGKPGAQSRPNPSVDDKITSEKVLPKTGYGLNTILYEGLMVMSGCLLFIMELKKRKKQNINEEK